LIGQTYTAPFLIGWNRQLSIHFITDKMKNHV